MGAPGPPAGASRLRTAGVVLLVVAALAAVVGLLSLGSRGGPTSAAGPSGTTPRPPAAAPLPPPAPSSPPSIAPAPIAPAPAPVGPGSGTPSPSGSQGAGAPPPPGVAPGPGSPPGAGSPTGPSSPPGPGAGPAPGAPPGAGGETGGETGAGGGEASLAALQRSVTVRVYNNSTIKGLAERAAQDMRDLGWTVSQVGNYPNGRIATTTVYYRPGAPEQAAAAEMGREFGMRVLPRFPGIAQASPGVIVILTRDFHGEAVK